MIPVLALVLSLVLLFSASLMNLLAAAGAIIIGSLFYLFPRRIR